MTDIDDLQSRYKDLLLKSKAQEDKIDRLEATVSCQDKKIEELRKYIKENRSTMPP